MKQLILRIKDVEREQQRRQNSPLARYNKGEKIHAKQMEFHRCQKRNRWVFGGNRSGKTECGAVETVWLARGIHPFRHNRANVECWVVSLSRQVQRDVAQQKVLYYLPTEWISEVCMAEGRKDSPSYGIIDFITVRNVFGGESKIVFKSCESGREKFQGTSLDFVWFDEEPPYDVYQECRMRVLDRRGEIFGTMTPLKGLSWVYDEIYLNRNSSDEVWCCFMEWADNPFLDEKEVQFLSETLSKADLESRRYGRFCSNSGLVYGEFDENTQVIDPFPVPSEWQDGISIDPGLNNPLSCHWYARDGDGNVYVVAEHYAAGHDAQWHAQKILEKCNLLGWKKGRSGKVEALIDSAANQRTLSGMRTVAELFNDCGIAVNTRVNKDLSYGINVVKGYMGSEKPRKLYIFRTCSEMIREIKSYFWGEGDKPEKKFDHSCDEMRYYLCSLPDYKAEKAKQSWVEKDKERLLKKQLAGRKLI